MRVDSVDLQPARLVAALVVVRTPQGLALVPLHTSVSPTEELESRALLYAYLSDLALPEWARRQ